MAEYYNRARMSVSSAPGTGNIALGSAASGYQSFAAAGVQDQNLVPYVAESGYSNGIPGVWEFGYGTYTASGTSFARTTILKNSSGTTLAMNLGADCQVFITPLASDLLNKTGDTMTGPLNINMGASGTSGLAITGTNPGIGAAITLNGSGATTPQKTIRVRAGFFEFINSAYNAVIAGMDDVGNFTAASFAGNSVVANGYDNGGNGGQFRAVSGNFGAFMRNDGSNVYLLQTASGAPYGMWNLWRPFQWSLSTGVVTIDGTGSGCQFGGTVSATVFFGSGNSLSGVVKTDNGASGVGLTVLGRPNASVGPGATASSVQPVVESSGTITLQNPITGTWRNVGSGPSNTGTSSWFQKIA